MAGTAVVAKAAIGETFTGFPAFLSKHVAARTLSGEGQSAPPHADGGPETETVMPYGANQDLPSALRNHLPEHAQEIYREAFNRAYKAHADDPRREEAAHRIAWAAVKRSYVKTDDEWVRREEVRSGS